MRKFAESYEDMNYAAAAAQIPWGHNILLLDRLDDPARRLWYIRQAIENGWSRSELEAWIDSNLKEKTSVDASIFDDRARRYQITTVLFPCILLCSTVHKKNAQHTYVIYIKALKVVNFSAVKM
jgi:predicted nuclease of restriction endonuclease-like (RecB) superfamily